MIEQTVPYPILVQGLARCVREWLLPHLTDPMARGQAEQLATILDALPNTYSAPAGAAIQADSAAARAVLVQLGESVPVVAATSVDELMQDNAVLKQRLEALATAARTRGDAPVLERLRRFFAESLARETAASGGGGGDFAAIAADDAKRRTP